MPIKLNKIAFEKYQQQHNLGEVECAKKMSISPSQIWKVKEGIHDPGVSFIAGALDVFPEASFDELFFLTPVSRQRNTNQQPTLPKTG